MTRVPTAISFLDAVTGHLANGQTSSADRPIRLATVDPAYNPFAPPYPNGPTPPARVTFDGESTLSGKAYPVAGGFVPQPGRRVVMVPVGNTYLISGALGGQSPQGFWAASDGTEYGLELGGGSYWDTTDGLVLETDATIQGILQVGGRRAVTGPGSTGKIHWGSYTVPTDSNGVATITHGAGFSPTFIQPGQYGSATTTSPVHILYVSGSATSTTLQVRCFLVTTGAALASSSGVGVSLILA